MAYTVTKTVKRNGKTYSYKRLQASRREGKKVKSLYLGSAEGPRRKRVSFAPALALPFYGLAYLARKAIDPNYQKGRHFKDKEQGPDPRSLQGKTLEQSAMELVSKDYRLMSPHEHSIQDAWLREQSLMSREEFERHLSRFKAHLDETRPERVEKITAPPAHTQEKQEHAPKSNPTDKDEANLADRIESWDNVSSQQQAAYNSTDVGSKDNDAGKEGGTEGDKGGKEGDL